MINRVGIDFGRKFNSNLINRKPNNNSANQNSTFKTQANQDFKGGGRTDLSYFIPFTGGADKSKSSGSHKMSKLENILYYADTPSKNLINALKPEAKADGYDRITTLHVIRHGLVELDKYIDDLNSGKKDFNAEFQPPLAMFFGIEASPKMLVMPELRKKIQPVVKAEILNVSKILERETPDNADLSKDIGLSDDLIDSMYSIRKENENVEPYTIVRGALISRDEITSSVVENFLLKLDSVLMKNSAPMTERAPFSEYEKKAKNVLKNLSLGTNIFVTYDNSKEVPANFLDTVQKVHEQSGDKKITLTELNFMTKPNYFAYVVNTLAKDKSRQHIVAANPTMMMMLSSTQEQINNGTYNLDPEFAQIMLNPPSNVKFLFYDTKDNYYTTLSSNIAVFYSDFEEAALPTLSTKQMIKSFKENPVLMKDIQKPFSKNAVEMTVEASARLEGAFPEKTQNLMKKIVSYYIDKKEINDKDVANYIKEATSLFKKNGDDSSVEVIFDTGKKLNDIIGKSSTKKEAAAIVKQIKSNKMGTKGVVVYSQDGSPGSGRRYTAKAIAGEARVPYIEMNTMDFGTKEVNLFGGSAISPEASMKKLFSLVTTQAEANANKSAVLFIENFEYFSVGEMVSLYHQKAMAQLLREMEKADKAGLNILVAGSVANPNLIGEATMKSFKFVDSIEVSSPAFNKDERAKILERAIKDAKIKLEGNSEEQKDIIDSAAHITRGFPFIYLKNIVKKAKAVALERGHKAVNKSDFTEAYLQIMTGRPAVEKIENHTKVMTTSHECGHAVNLEVMNNLAKSKGKPWHVPDKVNFVTLDPRGYYGGAVYHGRDFNKEVSFESVFASIVTSFGGNSAENIFFDMDGSGGISCDMESVRHYAEFMVRVMGAGAKTGKMATDINENLSDKMKTMIEDDERVIINNAKIASDLITEVYADFNKQFTDKYSPLVGTGSCLIDGDDFRYSLNEWKAKQPKDKQEEFKLCDDMILRIIDCTKKGVAVSKK